MRGKEKRSYTMKDYEKVLELREKGLTFEEISEKVDVGRTTCTKWLNTDRKPRSDYAERKTKDLKSGYQKLDDNLAYIYGVITGDGYLEDSNGTYRVGLNVTDEDFAAKFEEVLRSWTGLEPTVSRREVNHDHVTKYGCPINCKTECIEVRLSSKKAVRFLEKKSDFKTREWSVPDEIKNSSVEEKSAFLRGIFDSEGFPIHSGTVRRIELEMKNKSGLKSVKKLLKDLEITSYIGQSSKQEIKNTFLLRIYDRKSIENFEKKINFSINRKSKSLDEITNSYKK